MNEYLVCSEAVEVDVVLQFDERHVVVCGTRVVSRVGDDLRGEEDLYDGAYWI